MRSTSEQQQSFELPARRLTQSEQRDVPSLHPSLGSWYVSWVDAGFTRDEVAAWYPLTARLGKLPDWAQRLRSHGLTPAQVKAAVDDPVGQFSGQPFVVPFAASSEVELRDDARQLVLCQFLYALTDATAVAIASRRGHLTRKLALSGLADVQMAEMLGLTKQRVGAIRKGKPRPA